MPWTSTKRTHFDATAALWRVRSAVPPQLRRSARVLADAVLSRRAGSINGIVTDSPFVALTYDDGPDPSSTPAVLDALAERSWHATFFVLATKAVRVPEVIQRMVDEGHEVALHGWDHSRPDLRAGRAWREDVLRAKQTLEGITGTTVRYYRPPYGAQSRASWSACRAMGLEVVVWDQHGQDWVDDAAAAVVRRVVEGLRPGGVLLMHDAFEGPPGATPPRFDRGVVASEQYAAMVSQGWRGLSVAEMLETSEARRTAWFRP